MAVTHGSSTPAAAATCEITTGIVTGVGAGGSGTCSEGLTHVAKCNGSTDDNKAFVNFNNWALNWQRTNSGLIELFIPSGVTCVYKQTSLAFAGVKQLLIYGYGATLTGPVHWLAGDGQRQNNMHSTRVQNYASSTGGQINARDTSVKVYPGSSSQPAACSTVARCVGLFTVGQWAVLTGVNADPLPGYGYPSSPFFFDYVKVTGVDTSSGVISFDRAVTYNYKTTWPAFFTGSSSEVDQGGPATLYAFWPTFDTQVEWRGVTFLNIPNEQGADGAYVTFRDVTWSESGQNQNCIAPTQNFYIALINVTATNCSLEMDKINDTVVIQNSNIGSLNFQSSSGAKHLTVENTILGAVNGTPQNATVDGATIGTLRIGPNQGFGRTDTLTVSNSTITTLVGDGFGFYGSQAYPPPGINNVDGISMSDGVITIANSLIKAPGCECWGWFVPGNNLAWNGIGNQGTKFFQITDVTQDDTYTYIHTNATGNDGSWPDFTPGTRYLGVVVHPALKVSFINVTGGYRARSISTPEATGLPFDSYAKLTFQNADTPGGPPAMWVLMGLIDKLNIDVTTAYTGSLTARTYPTDSWFTTSYGTASFRPYVNLKIGGLRSLDASGGSYPVPWTGGQSGDVLPTLTQSLWGGGNFLWNFDDISSDANHPISVTIEVKLNQGVVLPYYMR
jgi:hypothetical protein